MKKIGEKLMNTLLNGLKEATNFGYTENGAVKRNSTLFDLYDLFALGGAYRQRSDEDCIFLFKKAYQESPEYALKCLFYLRDITEGQGERRFFKTCLKWLSKENSEMVKRNIKYIPMFGRWDDLYCLIDTPVKYEVFNLIKEQLMMDMGSKTPSLLAKWLKSENTSSLESRKLAKITRQHLGLTARQYRKTLSVLREKINVLERLMSAGQWDKIEFDKIPSKAGLIYRNAFARHDVERAQANARTYEDFIKDKDTKVNAGTLYPYEIVEKAIAKMYGGYYYYDRGVTIALDDTERLAINKYWDNLKDYFENATLNALPVIDTSGSMWGNPINVAISLGLYCAERNPGPFKDHYISFSSRPRLIRTEGVDFCDKVKRIYDTNLCQNTDIEATFDLILNTAIANNMTSKDLPEHIIIISDMEFDQARRQRYCSELKPQETLMEGIRKHWEIFGFKMPKLVFWNVNARQDNIPMRDENGITFVSGFSPVVFEMVMSGRTAQDLMFDKLNSERYSMIK